MNSGGGKAKGGEFERKVCKDLSLWITNGDRDDIFWRSAMSGGRASVKFKKGEKSHSQTGDITAIDPIGNSLTDKFIIECKTYKDLKLIGMIYNTTEKTGIVKFWNKLLIEAKNHGKQPMLIAKENRRDPIVGLSFESAMWFQQFTDILPVVKCYLIGLCIYPYDTFFSYLDPSSLEIK
jgi:hypothetical protein